MSSLDQERSTPVSLRGIELVPASSVACLVVVLVWPGLVVQAHFDDSFARRGMTNDVMTGRGLDAAGFLLGLAITAQKEDGSLWLAGCRKDHGEDVGYGPSAVREVVTKNRDPSCLTSRSTTRQLSAAE